ncbi:MAG TPA: hypothetical protein VMV77_05730 [Bacteroidales bacterium]|nr:hypothetical protein [Bacteroidales bacterium]
MKSEENTKNGYALSRQWFDFVSESNEKITPIHTALYFWIVELNNKLLWKDVFGLPTLDAMRRIRIKDRRCYRKTLQDIKDWGFIEIKSKSINQYASTQISLIIRPKSCNALYLEIAPEERRFVRNFFLQEIYETEEAKKKSILSSSAYAFNAQAKCVKLISTNEKESFAYAPDAPINKEEEDKPPLNEENPYSEEPNPLGSKKNITSPSDILEVNEEEFWKDMEPSKKGLWDRDF